MQPVGRHSFAVCCVLLLSTFSISASSAQTEQQKSDTTINGFSCHPIAKCLMISVSFFVDCQLMMNSCFIRFSIRLFFPSLGTKSNNWGGKNRSTASGSELVVGQQIGGSHVHWHVGKCCPKCPGDYATATPPSARHFTVPGFQLLWRTQQHAELHALPDHQYPIRTTTTSTISASHPTTTTKHDRFQRSTRSQS